MPGSAVRRFLGNSMMSLFTCAIPSCAKTRPVELGGLSVVEAVTRVGHRALESDVQVRNVALGKGDDVDAGERQSFEETRGVLLVATEAVERFRQDDVESAVHVADPHAFNAAVTQSTES